MRPMKRREMLRISGAGLCAAAIGNRAVGAAAAPRQPGIALQLYSVRHACAEDFDAALEAVAGIGCKAVEFAGYYKYRDDAAGLRKRLDELGLAVAGTHVGAGTLTDPKAIEFHRTIGCRRLIVPGDKRVRDAEKSKEFAELLNRAAETLKPHGMFCGYHNHTHEFAQAGDGDKTWWDLLAERTAGDVVLQMDVGHVTRAGCDPVSYLRKYPGRTRTAHFSPAVAKGDKEAKIFIGEDSIAWREVIAACREVGGTDWFIVEQEKRPGDLTQLECAERSLNGLKAIIAGMG